jgi:hypothetical protein
LVQKVTGRADPLPAYCAQLLSARSGADSGVSV